MSQQTDLDNRAVPKRDELRWPLRAQVVLEDYRLNVRDLLNGPARNQSHFQTLIINVSLEGVEELNVLLHLEGLSKPLRLTPDQRQKLAATFQSHNHVDWIGQPLTLHVSKVISHSAQQGESGNHIELIPIVDSRKTASPSTSRPQSHVSGTEEATPANPVQQAAGLKKSARTQSSYTGVEAQTHSPFLSWIQIARQSPLIKQARLLMGSNFFIALILFLLIFAVVQFEQIADLFARFLP